MIGFFHSWGLFSEALTTDIKIYLGATILFLLFYFSLASITFFSVRSLNHKGWLQLVNLKTLLPGQIATEIRLSFLSILIFGFYAVLVWRGNLNSWWSIGFDFHWGIFLIEVIALFLWNELHFFISHRLLHIPFLFRKIHFIHHRSTRPTSFSAFSMHWVEAIILGSVMPMALIFFDFSIYGLFSLPVMSLVLNVLGHSNANVSPKITGLSFSLRHSLHHSKVTANYGFALPTFDKLIGSNTNEKGYL